MSRMFKTFAQVCARPLAAALIAATVAGVAVSPARADRDRKAHRDPVVIVNRGHQDNLPVVEYGRGRDRGHGRGHGHRHGHGCECGGNGCGPSRSWAQQEYDLGVKAGRHDGFDRGYADGAKGRCFDDCVTSEPCDVSKPFRDGYFWAFDRAYARGYEQGKYERSCHQPRGRSEWNWNIRW